MGQGYILGMPQCINILCGEVVIYYNLSTKDVYTLQAGIQCNRCQSRLESGSFNQGGLELDLALSQASIWE